MKETFGQHISFTRPRKKDMAAGMAMLVDVGSFELVEF